MSRRYWNLLLLGCALLSNAVALGQTYPTRPVRIVTAEPGSGIDLTARLIAPALTASLGQPVVVENYNTIVSIENGLKAAPDGHTLLLSGSTLWILPYMRDDKQWDPLKDFPPISLVTNSPNILAVYPGLPVKSVQDLIALAKVKPGTLNYGSGSVGALPHLAAELFKSMAGVDIVMINYKGTGPAITGVIGGQVQMIIPAAGAVAEHIKSGRLRGLAVTTAQPSSLFPDLPTVASAGLPGYEVVQILGMFAPANTPTPIINKLNQEIVRYLKTTEAKERFTNAGAETVGSTPAQLTATMKADMSRMSKVIKDAHIHVE